MPHIKQDWAPKELKLNTAFPCLVRYTYLPEGKGSRSFFTSLASKTPWMILIPKKGQSMEIYNGLLEDILEHELT